MILIQISLICLSLLVAGINHLQAQEAHANTQKKYFMSSDEFPGSPIGYKIIGKFKVSKFSNGGYYLDPDTKRGEKETMRRFVPRNKNIQPNESYTFTSDMPLTIVSKSFLGQYDVDLPPNSRTDHEMEILQRQEAAQNAEKERIKKDKEIELIKNIPSYAASCFELQKKSEYGNFPRPAPFEILGGFGKLPWGSDLEATIIFSEIPPGNITRVIDFQKEYSVINSDLKKRLLLHIDHTSLIESFKNDNVMICADLRAIPNFGVVMGQQGSITHLYLLSDSRLYAYCKIFNNTTQSSQSESISVLIEALNIKYGVAKVGYKTFGNKKMVNMKWTNEYGTVCLVLTPPDNVMREITKVQLDHARKQINEKNQQLKNEYGDNTVTSAIQELTELPIVALQKAIEQAEKQMTVGGLLYYSNKTLNYADEADKIFSQVLLKDKEEWEKKQAEERNVAAKSMQDSI